MAAVVIPVMLDLGEIRVLLDPRVIPADLASAIRDPEALQVRGVRKDPLDQGAAEGTAVLKENLA